MKYHNIKTYYKNIKYDSKKEAKRAYELELLQKAKKIRELERQKRFELQPSFKDNLGKHHRRIDYICDFFYFDVEKGIYIAEDVKSKITAKESVYGIKKKMFMYKYRNVVFKEVI